MGIFDWLRGRRKDDQAEVGEILDDLNSNSRASAATGSADPTSSAHSDLTGISADTGDRSTSQTTSSLTSSGETSSVGGTVGKIVNDALSSVSSGDYSGLGDSLASTLREMLQEESDRYVLTIDGVTLEDAKIEVNGQAIKISKGSSSSKSSQGFNSVQVFNQVESSFVLPPHADLSRLTTEQYGTGIKVTIPKKSSS